MQHFSHDGVGRSSASSSNLEEDKSWQQINHIQSDIVPIDLQTS